ncbi:hypothetical protein SAMN02910292_01166 [Lachnospiraceae bacterium XBB2008]|nr:hypothetical protein SAMN02910292_01166 [Lachnospiraceae bacterium XBB2008]
MKENRSNTEKNKMLWPAIAVISGMLIIAAVLVIFVIPNLNTDIKAERTGRIGEHIYYPKDSFFSEERTEEQNTYIRDYLESIDQTLDDDVYLTHCMYYPSTGRIEISATAYVDGVALSYYPYTATTENDEGFVQKFSRMERPELDTSGLLDPKKLIPDVREFASQNTDKMLMDKGDTIYGTYLLRYDMEKKRLYYEFTLNYWSYVNVDAKTGEFIGWRFYDGAVY